MGARAERWRMISATWRTLKDVVLSFVDDEALTRGAAIAFYTATSIAHCLIDRDCDCGARLRTGGRSKCHNFAV